MKRFFIAFGICMVVGIIVITVALSFNPAGNPAKAGEGLFALSFLIALVYAVTGKKPEEENENES